MFHSGVEFVPLFDFCGLTNVISEFILIFKRSKNSTPKENNSVDGDDDEDGIGGVGGSDTVNVDDDAEGCSNIIQWYDVLKNPHADAFQSNISYVCVFLFTFFSTGQFVSGF